MHGLFLMVARKHYEYKDLIFNIRRGKNLIGKRLSRTWLPGPPVRNGPVRSVVRILFGPDFFGPVRGTDISVRIFLVRSVVRIFRSGFFWSGPWSGYFGPDFIGPVRVRIFGPDNPYRSGFFCGPVRGPDFFFKIKKSGPDQFRLRNFGPVRILVRIFQ